MPAPQPRAPGATSDPLISTSLARKFLKLRGEGKQKYQESDEVMQALIPLLQPGEIVRADDGTPYKFVDNYAESNTAYKATGVSRFDLKELTKKEAAELL